MSTRNIITDDINENISKCIENSLSIHLNKETTKIVDNETLFNYDIQFNNLEKIYPNIRKINRPYIQKFQNILFEKLNVRLYIGNNNTLMYDKFRGEYQETLTFYTDTNLMVKITNPSVCNGSSCGITLFTNDNSIYCCYGNYDFDGTRRPLYSEEPNLDNYKKLIYKYISPYIYLDYYLYHSNEAEINELLFSSNKTNMLNEVNKEQANEIEQLKNKISRNLKLVDEQNAFISSNLNKINDLYVDIDKYKLNETELKNELRKLCEQNKNLINEIKELNNIIELNNVTETKLKDEIEELKKSQKTQSWFSFI